MNKKVFITDFDVIPNEKTGTWVTCALHFACAMIGSGVLAYPKAVASMGWVAGIILIVVFYFVSLHMAHLLGSCYRADGLEFSRYHHAINHILGEKAALACSIFQFITIFVATIAWTITGATSAVSIANEFCVPEQPCFNKIWVMSALFGAVELLLSQVPSLEEATWLSVIGVAMSFVYSGIAFIISIIDAAKNGAQGTLGGMQENSTAKAMDVLNGLGIIALGFSGGQILLEIQDTLRQPPMAVPQMKKASTYALTSAFLFYLAVAVTGYAAYGNSVNGFIIDSLEGPTWAVVLANAAILIHVLTAYQIMGQAAFNTIESHIKWWLLVRQQKRFGSGGTDNELDAAVRKAASVMGFQKNGVDPLEERLSSRISSAITARRLQLQGSAKDSSKQVRVHFSKNMKELGAHASYVGVLAVAAHSRGIITSKKSSYLVSTGLANEEVPANAEHILAPLWVRLIVRSFYVFIVTLVSAAMPFFSAIAGLTGAVIFFPLIVHFPIVMSKALYPSSSRTYNATLTFIYWGFLAVCLAAIVGSVYSLVQSLQTFTFFGIG